MPSTFLAGDKRCSRTLISSAVGLAGPVFLWREDAGGGRVNAYDALIPAPLQQVATALVTLPALALPGVQPRVPSSLLPSA
jgi:hypothetical protein